MFGDCRDGWITMDRLKLLLMEQMLVFTAKENLGRLRQVFGALLMKHGIFQKFRSFAFSNRQFSFRSMLSSMEFVRCFLRKSGP